MPDIDSYDAFKGYPAPKILKAYLPKIKVYNAAKVAEECAGGIRDYPFGDMDNDDDFFTPMKGNERATMRALYLLIKKYPGVFNDKKFTDFLSDYCLSHGVSHKEFFEAMGMYG